MQQATENTALVLLLRIAPICANHSFSLVLVGLQYVSNRHASDAGEPSSRHRQTAKTSNSPRVAWVVLQIHCHPLVANPSDLSDNRLAYPELYASLGGGLFCGAHLRLGVCRAVDVLRRRSPRNVPK